MFCSYFAQAFRIKSIINTQTLQNDHKHMFPLEITKMLAQVLTGEQIKIATINLNQIEPRFRENKNINDNCCSFKSKLLEARYRQTCTK